HRPRHRQASHVHQDLADNLEQQQDGQSTDHPAPPSAAPPRRWQAYRCGSSIPVASMSACMGVGPTKVKPRLFNAFDSATGSGEVVSACGTTSRSGRYAAKKVSKPPSARSATVARALVTAARILARLRTIRASVINRSTSSGP